MWQIPLSLLSTSTYLGWRWLRHKACKYQSQKHLHTTYASTAIRVTVTSEASLLQVLIPKSESPRHLQSSKVPSSRIARLFHYGGINQYRRPTRFLCLMFR